MAYSNQTNSLLITTGNKSELCTGYCTLYGDMNGALNPIGDLYKSEVFRLCHFIDSKMSTQLRSKYSLPLSGPLIGNSIIEKAPSAELAPDQLDSDSLPDYKILDPILHQLVDKRSNPESLLSLGFTTDQVNRVLKLINRSEFKRKQSPPIIRVSTRSFGRGWRMPIASAGSIL